MQTRVVNITTDPQYQTDPMYVYIGRVGFGQSGYFGNPFRISKEISRSLSLTLYTRYFMARIVRDSEFKLRILALKGHILGCFCKPLDCHGDVIVAYLENHESN